MAPAPPPLALAYHGVADVPPGDDPRGLFVRPGDLRRHVERLRGWGYRLVAFGELAALAARGEAAGCAALTFDDGLADNLEALVPLLREEEAPGTVFVVSGLLGEPYPWFAGARFLTAGEVAALAAEGVEIGAHSTTHRDLSALTYEEARRDLEECRRELERVARVPVDVAAYPFGRATADTVRACRDAGFRAACRASGEGSWAEPWNLPRQDMDNRCTMLGLRLKRDGLYEPLMRWRLARAGRRLRRRARALGG